MTLDNKKTTKSPFLIKIEKFVKHPFFGFIVAGLVLILILLLNQSKILSTQNFRAIGKTVIYFVVALGFMLLLGYAGLSSLGTAGFIGLGTYIIGFLTTNYQNDELFKGLGLPVILAFLVAFAIAMIVGTVVGFISLRIEGMYLAIITLGLSQILVEVFKTATSLTNGSFGLNMTGVNIFGNILSRDNAYVLLIVVTVIAMMLVSNIISSPTGRAMLSMKNSASAAQAMGMSLLKYRLLAFVLSTIFAVIAGGFYVLFYGTTRPDEWNLTLSLNILAAVVVGGSKSIWGVLLGSFVIFGFDDIVLKQIPFFAKNGNASAIVSGVLIILVIIFYPGGLVRLVRDIKKLVVKGYYAIKNSLRRGTYGDDKYYPASKEQFIIQQRAKVGK